MPSREYVEEMAFPNLKTGAWVCDELRRGPNCQLLLLDCRPQAEYLQGHIRGAVNVTLPTLMLRRLANGKLSVAAAFKCSEAREKFTKCSKTHTLVLCGSSLPSSDDSVLLTLLRRLHQDGCRVVVLEGGYQEFQLQYPEWCKAECSPIPSSPAVLGLQNLHISSCSDTDSSSDSDDQDSNPELSCDDSPFPVEILPYLFLGNAKNSADQTALEKYQIRYILNVTPNLPNAFEQGGSIKYMQIPISDHWSQNLASFFPDAIAFIDEARQKKHGVLVHCLAGISRSVTITVAYLMQKLSMPLNDAYDFVKKRKANISPNFNFMGQLLDFERQLNLSPLHCKCPEGHLCRCFVTNFITTPSSTTSSTSSSTLTTPSSSTSSVDIHFSSPLPFKRSSPDSGLESEDWM